MNRVFREKGWLQIKDELDRETLDCGASRAFAIADHQIAHIYVNDPSIREEVRSVLEATPGVDEVRVAGDVWAAGIATERSGDFIAISQADAWFTYYFWKDDAVAPDYARTIDIHRKPCELFLDPRLRLPKLKIAKFLLKKKLGLRGLLDVIPLDATLVKGSHGRDAVADHERPVLLGISPQVASAQDIHQVILDAVRA